MALRLLLRWLVGVSYVAFGSYIVASVRADDVPPAAATTASSDGPYRLVGKVKGGADTGPSPFSADSAEFITVEGEMARGWNTRTLKPVTEPLCHPQMRCASVSADGKTVCTWDETDVDLWDVATSKLKSSSKVATVRLLSVDISPDGKQFLAVDVGGDKRISLWHSGEARPRFSVDGAAISAEFNPAGTAFIVNIHRKEFQVYSADTGRSLCPPIPSDDKYFAPGRASFTKDGRRLLAPRDDGFVVVDTATGAILTEVKPPHDAVMETGLIRFSPDDKMIIFTYALPISGDPTPVRIYDAATGKLQRQFGSKIVDCQIASGGRRALCTRWLEPPELWDLTNGHKLQVFPITGEYVAHLSPDGSAILLSPARGPTQMWRLREGM